MARSPGHRKWPDHQVREERTGERVQVWFNDEKVADSSDAVKVMEDNHPPRYYLPREDVMMDSLERSDSTSECPFKGSAHYYSLTRGDRRAEDAAWTYEEPYEEHEALKGRLAFDDEKVDRISVG